jgi:hypothetical protein
MAFRIRSWSQTNMMYPDGMCAMNMGRPVLRNGGYVERQRALWIGIKKV